MASIPIQITFYCADPASLAPFWATALGYKLEEPPEGFSTWQAFLAAEGVPEASWNDRSAVVDPDGKGPRLHFYRMEIPKSQKNRVHLDLTMTGGPWTPLTERRAKIDEAVAQLLALGATHKCTYDQDDEYWVGMRDPEGNEFCLQ